jgi:NAD+ kinase
MKAKRSRAGENKKDLKAVLLINPQKSQARKLGDEIMTELDSLKIKAKVFSFRESQGFTVEENCDVAISLGGDGTVLSVARSMAPLGIPVFPINLGTFGFIAGVHPLEWREVFGRWLTGKAAISKRLMLEVTVEREMTI